MVLCSLKKPLLAELYQLGSQHIAILDLNSLFQRLHKLMVLIRALLYPYHGTVVPCQGSTQKS